MRLDKFLAEAAIGTRKAVRILVKEGKISVNDEVILEPAAEINENSDTINYLGKNVIHTGKRYYMFYKPSGCVTARKDIKEKTVLDYFDNETANGLFPVGRLDKDTEGLILLTNDGEFDHKIMHPDKHVDKTYFFWAFGTLDEASKKHLNTGVIIGKDEALAKASHILVDKEGTFREHRSKMDLENMKTIKIKDDNQQVVSGYITISEGRKHQVKRMLKAVGCYVIYLKRISIGELKLDESLNKGQYRQMDENEIRLLQ